MTVFRSVARSAAAGLALTLVASGAAFAAAPALPQLNVTTNGKTMQVTGPLQSGATEIVFTTQIERVGGPVLVRLNPGVTADQVLAVLPRLQDPNSARPYGTLAVSAEAPRGKATHVQAYLAPGDYLALDLPQGPPKGEPAHAAFTITQAAAPMALPRPGATVRSIDFAFRGPTSLRRGELVRFVNQGFLAHMVIAIRVPAGMPARKVVSALRSGNERSLPRVQSFTLVPVASSGASQQERLNLRRGTYVLACFMDTQDGREHTKLGMERIVRVR